MTDKIQQIFLILFFFTFPSTNHSKDFCPISSCGEPYVRITYPFKLETDQPPKDCLQNINLKCNYQGQTIINFPASGDFYVSYISYHTQKMALTDPGNCLARRLMRNLTFYPLQAVRYKNYTFYTCPIESANEYLIDSIISCLSNLTNATVATTEYVEEKYGCKPIVSLMIPITDDSFGIFEEFQLTWNFPLCKFCKQYGVRDSEGSKGRSWQAKYAASPFFIPSLVGFAIIFMLCLLYLVKRSDRNGVNSNPPTVDQLPQSATATVAPPRGGLDDSEIDFCTEFIALCESTTNPGPDSHACSICLEMYLPQDIIRRIAKCEHCFHSDCIELWLRRNNTCPVCRTNLSRVR